MDAPEGGYFEFQVTGIIEWGQISKPQKIPYGFQENPKNPGPKITPKKSHTTFPSDKNFQKVFNDTTQNKNITNRMFEFVYSSYVPWHYNVHIPQIKSHCFEYPKDPYLNKANQKYLLNFPTQNNPGIKNFKPPKILFPRLGWMHS